MRIPHRALFLFLATLALPLIAHAEDDPGGGRRGGATSLLERLKSWDKDGDGTITRDEFQGPDRLWSRLDRDGNGRITTAEAEQASADRQRGGRPARGGSTTTAPGLQLKHLDTDGDGKVTASEWSAFFEAADTDGDGSISKAEFAAMVKPPSRAGGKAPAVGDAAPAVKAVTLDGETVVDLARPKRATVLVFGSWT